MVRRSGPEGAAGPVCPGPDLVRAQTLELLGSHLLLSLAVQPGVGFHVRRDLGNLLPVVAPHLVWPSGVLGRLREHLRRRCEGQHGWDGEAQLSPEEFLVQHGHWRGQFEENSLFFHLEDFARDHPQDMLAVLAASARWLAQALAGQRCRITDNVQALAELLQMDEAERAVLFYGCLARCQRELRSVLVEFKVASADHAHHALAQVAGVDAQALAQALRVGGRLERLGLVDNLLFDHQVTDLGDLMKVSEKLPAVLMREYTSRQALMAVFARPAVPTELTCGDFAHVDGDLAVLERLLRHAVQRRQPGINVLIYGPPGTGKTALAHVLAQAAGLALYEVEYADREGRSLSGRDRYRSLQMAQAFLQESRQAALLFDEVEDVFPPLAADAGQWMTRADSPLGRSGGAMTSSVSGKAWVNQILESNPVPTLWITNHIEQIDPAFRRRFAYHLALPSPPPGARESLIRRAMEGVIVSEPFAARLAARPGLTPAQIHAAVGFARLAACEHQDPQETEALIERQLRNADLALGRQVAASGGGRSPLPWSLDWLHVESRYPVARIVQAVKARGHGTLCFYGPPGTGKTALAEHLAQALECPLMIRQASDLLSKYVGETEARMAAMFRDAEAEKAVLLLDEADSFLRDRVTAERSWEVTEVNEMLQGMERYRGVFVCTTNLLQHLDQAALRRFTFKLRFKPLLPAQRVALFVGEVLQGRAEDLSPAMSAQLDRLDQLCPGDFATVRRQADILGEVLTPDDFLAQLVHEHQLKPEVRGQRQVGFLQ